MDFPILPVRLASGASMPRYANDYASGMDLAAFLSSPLSVFPGKRMMVPTGVFVEIPLGYEGQVRPRSGLAAKKGMTVLNTPGTIDCDYRGEIVVILLNTSDEVFTIQHQDRIAQLVIVPILRVTPVEVQRLTSTERGTQGFGSTGV